MRKRRVQRWASEWDCVVWDSGGESVGGRHTIISARTNMHPLVGTHESH